MKECISPENLILYADGSLPENIKQDVEKHFVSCIKCKKEAESLNFMFRRFETYSICPDDRAMSNYSSNSSDPSDWIIQKHAQYCKCCNSDISLIENAEKAFNAAEPSLKKLPKSLSQKIEKFLPSSQPESLWNKLLHCFLNKKVVVYTSSALVAACAFAVFNSYLIPDITKNIGVQSQRSIINNYDENISDNVSVKNIKVSSDENKNIRDDKKIAILDDKQNAVSEENSNVSIDRQKESSDIIKEEKTIVKDVKEPVKSKMAINNVTPNTVSNNMKEMSFSKTHNHNNEIVNKDDLADVSTPSNDIYKQNVNNSEIVLSDDDLLEGIEENHLNSSTKSIIPIEEECVADNSYDENDDDSILSDIAFLLDDSKQDSFISKGKTSSALPSEVKMIISNESIQEKCVVSEDGVISHESVPHVNKKAKYTLSKRISAQAHDSSSLSQSDPKDVKRSLQIRIDEILGVGSAQITEEQPLMFRIKLFRTITTEEENNLRHQIKKEFPYANFIIAK